MRVDVDCIKISDKRLLTSSTVLDNDGRMRRCPEGIALARSAIFLDTGGWMLRLLA